MDKYEPIGEVQNIVSMLVENIYNNPTYQTHINKLENSESEKKKAIIIKKTFSDLHVFNSNSNPLFLAKDIGILMGVKNINSTIKSYTDQEKIAGYVLVNGKEKKKMLLTRNGVCRLMMNGRTKLAEVFRKFIYELLDHMMKYNQQKSIDIINKISRENPELIKESIIELNDNVEMYKKLYEIEKKECEIWIKKAEEEYIKRIECEEQTNQLDCELYQKEGEIYILRGMNEIYKQKTKRRDLENELVQKLKNKFCKEVYIYVVSPVFIEQPKRKKKKTEIYEEEDAEINEYEIKQHSDMFAHAGDPELIMDELMFYNIRLSKKEHKDFVLMDTDWIEDKNVFNKLCDVLKKSRFVIVKKELLFYTTLDSIKYMIEESFIY
jgi:prophage antirepressor-like protein